MSFSIKVMLITVVSMLATMALVHSIAVRGW